MLRTRKANGWARNVDRKAGDRMQSQSAATRFIEFHWSNTFNLRTSVFDEEQRDPWHSRRGARCIHSPFLFETRAGANDSTCSYTSLLREDECSSQYSLRATNNVYLNMYIYKVYTKEFCVYSRSITKGMTMWIDRNVIIMLKKNLNSFVSSERILVK